MLTINKSEEAKHKKHWYGP